MVGCDSSSTFTYNVYRLDTLSNIWSPFTNYSYFYTSGISKTDLTIFKDLFSENPTQAIWKIELTVNVASSSNQSYQGSASMKILVNFPPVPGVCDVTPKDGNTTTLFYIMCDSWNDADGSIAGYTFYSKLA